MSRWQKFKTFLLASTWEHGRRHRLTPEELDAAEESGNGPSEMVGCGVIVCVVLVICGIAWAALYGVPWKGVAP